MAAPLRRIYSRRRATRTWLLLTAGLLVLSGRLTAAPGGAPVHPGEDMTFEVAWQGAPGGTVSIRIGAPENRSQRRAYRVTGEASSNIVVDQVFRVRDRVTSWTDTKTLTSLGYSEQREEGDQRRARTEFFGPEKKMQDILSSLLYVRAQPLAVGARLSFSVLQNETRYDVTLSVLSKESLDTAFGIRPCLKTQFLLRPKAGEEGSDVKAFVWFTADPRHIPVRITCDLPMGPVAADLAGYKAGQ